MDCSGHALASLQRVCRNISDVAERLQIIKQGETVAVGWHDSKFAVAQRASFTRSSWRTFEISASALAGMEYQVLLEEINRVYGTRRSRARFLM